MLRPLINDEQSFCIHDAVVDTFEDMKVSDSYFPRTWSWDVERIFEVFSEEGSARIFKTTPSPVGVPDMWVWNFAPNGIYLIKTYTTW